MGYMGVGKSTLGRLLAKSFQLDFIDLDDYIEDKEKLTIPELFKTKGEIYFRKKEREALSELLFSEKDSVLSLGGGTPVYGNNMQQIIEGDDAISVYLKLDLNYLVDKLFEERATRPLISHYNDKSEFEEFVRKHLFERQQFYYQADHILDVSGKNAQESLKDLLALLNKNV